MLLELTSAELAREGDSPGLYLMIWNWEMEGGDYLRGFGPFEALQAAFDAVAEVQGLCTDTQCILLNGQDETGYIFDAYEPDPGESADQFRAEMEADDDDWRSEARMQAGMAFGNRGLADFDGLDLDYL